MAKGALKVLHQALTSLHPSIRPFNNPARCHRNKSRFTLCCFLGFGGLRSELKANLSHDLWIERLQCFGNGIGMITVVEHDGDFWNVDGLSTKVVQVIAQHLNQALVIGDICFGAVREKRQSQRIDC